MSIFDSIISFFKNIFNKKENIKMLEAPTESSQNEAKREFANSLKVNLRQDKKQRVETLTCFGDGLGIQSKIEA